MYLAGNSEKINANFISFFTSFGLENKQFGLGLQFYYLHTDSD